MKYFLVISAIVILSIVSFFGFSKLNSIQEYTTIKPHLSENSKKTNKEELIKTTKKVIKNEYQKIEKKSLSVINKENENTITHNQEAQQVDTELKTISQTIKEVIAPDPIVIKYVPASKTSLLTEPGIVLLTNQNRKNNGLAELKQNSLLEKAAELKLKNMFDNQYFAHIGPDGNGPSYWITSAGYDYKSTGENLALGNFENDTILIQGWMDSPGHRENILNTKFTQIGVAVGKDVYEGQETWLAVQEFGKPMPICNNPEQVLKDQIESNNNKIENLKTDLENLQITIDESEDPVYHNQKVDEYNTILPTYNDLIDKTKALVDRFNAEVSAYNLCMTE